jgi:hypothetical protein
MSDAHGTTVDELVGLPKDGAAAAVQEATDAPADDDTDVVAHFLLRFLARIVEADDVIAPKERSMLERIGAVLAIDAAEAGRILDDEQGHPSDCAALAKDMPGTARRRKAYALGCAIAIVDGSIAGAERQLLEDFARGAEISAAESASILASVVSLRVRGKSGAVTVG